MSKVIQSPAPYATPEFRAWLRRIVADNVRRQRVKEVRAYVRRFFTSWVAEDPEPTYSTLDRADKL